MLCMSGCPCLQVQEASAATNGFWRMPDAWINLANVYLAQQQYVPAIQMYKNALRKFFDNRSALVMLYLARWVFGPRAFAGIAAKQASELSLLALPVLCRRLLRRSCTWAVRLASTLHAESQNPVPSAMYWSSSL